MGAWRTIPSRTLVRSSPGTCRRSGGLEGRRPCATGLTREAMTAIEAPRGTAVSVAGEAPAIALGTRNATRVTCSRGNSTCPVEVSVDPSAIATVFARSNGTESGMLGTIGAFRVVSESDLHDLSDDSNGAPESGGAGQCNSAARSALGLAEFWRPGGDGDGPRRKDQWLEQLNWR